MGAIPLLPVNLIAYDGVGRIFSWNSTDKSLHYIEVHDPSTLNLATFENAKSVKLSMNVTFQVRSLKFNRTGHLLLLAGDKNLMVVDVVPQASQECRAGMAAADIFNGRSFRVLDVSWHPYSDTHLGVLSSDSVFRLFNLSADSAAAEQEYHLQISLRSSIPGLKSFARAVAFAFGGEHLWDRFTVYIVFTDASVYALCPVVPFGSVFNSSCIKDLSKDAGHFSSLSETRPTKENSSLAHVWLEIVFPDLGNDSIGKPVLRAQRQVPFDASLVLQGPLSTVWNDESNKERSTSNHATSIRYNTIGKDSILAVATRKGHVLFYALADEVQPVWNTHTTPKLILDEDGSVISMGMLVEPSSGDAAADILVEDGDDALLANAPPPLLQLATVDLALPTEILDAGALLIFTDPLIPERFYCHHGLGVDAVILQWLPFSDDGSATKASLPSPSVFPVLDTSPTATTTTAAPLRGVDVLMDEFGEVWLVAVTSSGKCAVIAMKPQRPLPPLHINEAKCEEDKISDVGVLKLMSGDLLLGPKDIHIPQISSVSVLTLDTVEGRSVLHDHSKLLHEKYIEYAHRVHLELKSHKDHLGEVVEEMNKQVDRVKDRIDDVKAESVSFAERIQRAFETNRHLQERVRKCNNLSMLRNKLLTAAERDFKAQLEAMKYQDIEILECAVDALKLRSERRVRKEKSSSSGNKMMMRRRDVGASQMRSLKQAVDKIGKYVEICQRRLNLVDQNVKHKEAFLD